MAKRILAVDYGERRTGLALSDPSNILASPFRTLDSKTDGPPAQNIARIAVEEEVGLVLVGYPLHSDGSVGAMAAAVDRFIGELTELMPGMRIEKADEGYTSSEAEGLLMQRKRSRRGDKKSVDRMAAAILLQDYLNDPAAKLP